MTINRVLVANRGEIARRVFATCRRLGIETVAVFSDPDARLPFVREADVAVRLPGNTPAETYLRADLLVAVARDTDADAVHPGYGFLSENADFARQVIEAGLIWVGPAAESIEQMGSKIEAKKLVAEVGVPVLVDLAPGEITDRDLPVLVKASAGGGGRGMRVIRDLAEVAAQVELASSEAASAFGDSTVFCEPYVERGRHIEVQILVDAEGNTCALGERDCSIQRRHQKIVEETPAPGISDDTRKAMFRTASLVASSAHYLGAGTVEFLYAPETERFWFLEMNTRLQVEHPITECVTGLDLVAAQIAVAEGRLLAEIIPSGPRGESPWPNGHAVEARLYAEDPGADWQPQSGTLARFEVPEVAAEFANPADYGIRLDSGFASGDEVGTHYDAMLAKVIAWAPTRDAALRRLAGVLARAQIHGVRTNRDLLVNVLRDKAFVAGDVSTDLLDRHDLAALAEGPTDHTAVRLSAFAAAVVLAERARHERPVQQRIPVGWRNVTSAPITTTFGCGSEEVTVEWHGGRTGYRTSDETVHALEATATHALLTDKSGVQRMFAVFVHAEQVDVESALGHVALRRLPRFVDPADQVATGSLLAPMPGTVVRIAVAQDDPVSAGQPVLVLEAMKMQHTVTAPHDGVLTEIPVAVGQQVASGAVLAVVRVPESAAPEGETP
ncbi:MAG TPA: biotin carboxylase N-terminal domain-containing protein [Nocardioidaceae bacterium]|nr:biotin carboxylase N-terminal domain-containing protein [Nocardioidaceae bacterium]